MIQLTEPSYRKGDLSNRSIDSNPDLMLRLSQGLKAKVDPKAMKKLTSKNYSKLPEIVQKKEEQRKKEEMVKQQERRREYQRQLD